MNKKFTIAICHGLKSLPTLLKNYGYENINNVAEYNHNDLEDLAFSLRERLLKSPSIDFRYIENIIINKETMDREIDGIKVVDFIKHKGINPILKIDEGLLDEESGVKQLKEINELSHTLEEIKKKGILTTKMRSLIISYNEEGIKKIVKEQFNIAKIILEHGLTPIIEPEVNIKAKDRDKIEKLLKKEIIKYLSCLKDSDSIILKLTYPCIFGYYDDLLKDNKVKRIYALSCGLKKEDSLKLLKKEKYMIPSFSKEIFEGLNFYDDDVIFNDKISNTIKEIHEIINKR